MGDTPSSTTRRATWFAAIALFALILAAAASLLSNYHAQHPAALRLVADALVQLAFVSVWFACPCVHRGSGVKGAPDLVRDALLLFICVLLAMFVVSAIAVRIGISLPPPRTAEERTVGFLILSLLVGPVAEEMFFRGVLLQRLEKRGGFQAVFGSAAVFALLHIGWGRAFAVLNAFVVGVVFGTYVWKQNRLLPAIFAHVALNSVAFLSASSS